MTDRRERATKLSAASPRIMTYVFKCPNGDRIEAEASSEEQARDLAMRGRWGAPGDRIVPAATYRGRGLDLLSVSSTVS